MYAKYSDGFDYTTIGDCEDDCMYNICAQTPIHGECTWYSGATEFDEENDCYWVCGEYFSDYDTDNQKYIK